MPCQEGASQPKKKKKNLTRYLDAMTNEYPFIKRWSKHVNDH